MPLYEFLCSNCEHQDDIFGKLSDDSVLVCPVCKNKEFKKQVSAPHFKLKGSGWYETDFKNKPKSVDSKKDNEKFTKITKTKTEVSKNND
jgi:putative FmdB family regulatory protein|tara:strand:- start:587 stop:856 length:270 start_codon:yes stop_codon:yes gene_type:complete